MAIRSNLDSRVCDKTTWLVLVFRRPVWYSAGLTFGNHRSLVATAMKQAISGVAPAAEAEVTIMTVFPSIGGWGIGQFLGQLYRLRAGIPPIVTLGNLIALASIPLVIPLYFAQLALPGFSFRYRLTNRRVVVERGLRGAVDRWADLDNFDTIELVVLPGQEWYPCGELVFRKGQVETLRLSGVPHPEGFRRTCLKAQRAHVAVNRALGR